MKTGQNLPAVLLFFLALITCILGWQEGLWQIRRRVNGIGTGRCSQWINGAAGLVKIEAVFINIGKALGGALLLMAGLTAQAAPTCDAGQVLKTFAFSSSGPNSWSSGTSGSQVFYAGSGVSFTLSVSALSGSSNATEVSNDQLGSTNDLAFRMNQANSGQGLQIGLAFNNPVSKLEYVVSDVDFSSATYQNPANNYFQDQLQFSGTTTEPTLTLNTTVNPNHVVTYNPSKVKALQSSPANACADGSGSVTACNVQVNYTASLTTSTITYTAGPDISNPAIQYFGLNNLAFCVPEAAVDDFGDAPASYDPTGLGASHRAQNATLGVARDLEASKGNGFAGTFNGTQDDTTDTGSANDEDALASVAALNAGGTSYSVVVSVRNFVSGLNNTDGYLCGWIDLDGDGIFDNVNNTSFNGTNDQERVCVAINTPGSANFNRTLTWNYLSNTPAAGNRYIRLRLINQADSGVIDATGAQNSGEVEDYPITITSTRDYGDAPASYDTGTAASHIGFRATLGVARDLEASKGNGFAGTFNGTQDDTTDTGSANDEDALASVAALNAGGTSYSVVVSVRNFVSGLNNTDGYLCGWIDLDGDGIFDNVNNTSFNGTNDQERVCVAINTPGSANFNRTLTWNYLSNTPAAGNRYIRLRLINQADSGVIDATGAQNSGEVEDYPLTITSTADMSPTFGPLPAAVGAGQAFTGPNRLNLTCTNAGPGSALNATCTPSANVGTIENITCTPPTPATVPAGNSISCTFDYTAPGTFGGIDPFEQTVSFTGTTGATNDTNGGTGTGGNNTTTSTPRPIIDAVDDSATINGGTGGSTSVLTNDTNGTAGATVGSSGNVTLTNLSGGTFPPGGSALTVDTTTGLITVPPGATPGTYTVPYQICSTTTPAACDTAIATITVQGSDMQPSFTGVGLPTAIGAGQTITVTGGLTCTNNGPGSATSPTCTASTTTVGATVSTANCTSPTPPLASGGTIVCDLVITAPGSPGGSDVTATSVAVTGSTGATNDTSSGNNSIGSSVDIIDAVDDPNLGTINGTSGGTTTDSVLANDTRGTVGATSANVTVTLVGQTCIPTSGTTCSTLTLGSDGKVTVPSSAIPGTYTVTYRICEPATPCDLAKSDTAEAKITVTSGTTQALIGSFRASVNASGQTMVEWETVSEVNTVGFNLLRQDPVSGEFVQVNERLLPGLLTAPQGGVYRYPDLTVASDGTYTYRLQEVEADGTLRDYGPFTVTVSTGKQATRAAQAQPLAAEILADTDGYERAPHALNGRTVDSSAVRPMAATPQASTPNTAIRILVKQDGLYTVSADQIAAALAVTAQEVQTWINTGMVRLQQGGNPVAWRADPSGARLYFYGQAIQGVDSVYTSYNVYWLDHDSGVTMNVLDGAGPTPATSTQPFQSSIHVEQNYDASPNSFIDPDADFWYWNYALAGDAKLGAPQFAVTAPSPAAAGTVTLRVALHGVTDLAAGNDHHVRVLVNGTEVGDAAWDGVAPYVLTATFDAALLAANGNNTITVRGILDPGVSSSVFVVNGFDLDYPRTYQATDNRLRLRGAGNPVVTVGGFSSTDIAVLDISNPRQPQWVAATTVASAGSSYAVSFTPATPSADYVAAVAATTVSVTGAVASTLKTQNSGADYLVLAPTALRAGADALAAYRSGKVVELQDIYDAFNYGIANPNAIREFLSYAYDQWQPQPHYVALVGKGTYDPKDYKGLGTNLFPVLMANTPKGLFPSDDRYADVRNGDGVPELAVGRIPALTNTDVQNYVAKLQTYDGSSPLATALLVADNPDKGGNFTADSQAVADVLQQAYGFTTAPIYFQTGGVASTARQQIISTLNAGVGLFNYVGHGAPKQLASEGLLRNADVSQLSNGARLPVFLAFTCHVGNGSIPGTDSLVEALLWRQGGGAVAAVAPTGLSDNGQAHTLNLSLVDSLFSASPILGDAATAAKADFATHGGSRSMLDIYQVFGDPALRVKP